MMMSDMPRDLIEEILSRVPAASLKQLGSTCKRWNHLFKDQRFREKHFHKAPKQSRILISNDYRICSVNVELNVAPPPIEFKDFHSCSQQFDVVEVFHCDGLLLCNTHKDNNYRLMVWNPCLGETKWIQATTNSNSFSRCSAALGYQNNKSFRSYKILNCWSSIYSLVQGDAGFEVYELNSDSWMRVLDDFPVNCCSTLRNCGVSFKGNAYWPVLETAGYVLLGFDFTSDCFRRFCLPPVPSPWNMVLSVVRDEKLTLLNWSPRTSYMEVWMTHEINTQAALWSKSFTVKNPNIFSPCVKSFLIDEEKKLILGCNSAFGEDSKKLYTIGEDNEYYTEITSVGSNCKTLSPLIIFSYIPSLVQIQQGGSNGTNNTSGYS